MTIVLRILKVHDVRIEITNFDLGVIRDFTMKSSLETKY